MGFVAVEYDGIEVGISGGDGCEYVWNVDDAVDHFFD